MQVLHDTNEDMSNAFMKLHDYAVSHGILEMLPEFAQELRSTTEKFLILARKSSESGGGDSQAGSPGQESGVSDKSVRHQHDKSSSPEVVEAQPASNISNSIWGYSFSTGAELDPALTMADMTLPITHTAPISWPAEDPKQDLGYDMTIPALDDTDFTFSSPSLESFFSQSSASPTALTTTTPTLTPPSYSPYLYPLPLPSTMAFAEATFGRRLQRLTIESGYQLLTMTNPPQARYAKAFGFCLLFEPVEKIRARLRRGIEKSRGESLHHWPSPFWAVGGAGQHQFGTDAAVEEPHHQGKKRVGNDGTVDVAKHGFGTHFGLGPFDAPTADTRDRRLDAGMRIVLPGFEGEFFDPDEVEIYLHTRGVRIRPGQDYVTAEVDAAWFQGGGGGGDEEWAGEITPPTPSSSSLDLEMEAAAAGGWLGGNNVFGDARVAESLLAGGGKRIVTLDVGVLLRGECILRVHDYLRGASFGMLNTDDFAELVNNSTCLGRSAGFRPKDVNQAFWAATRSDGIMDF